MLMVVNEAIELVALLENDLEKKHLAGFAAQMQHTAVILWEAHKCHNTQQMLNLLLEGIQPWRCNLWIANRRTLSC